MAMMTTVHLLSVPFNSNYSNVIYWGSTTTQYNTMVAHVGKTYNNMNYIDRDKKVSVPHHIDTLNGYNYLMFLNHDDGSLWHYAFITKMTYINERCTEIEFDIDYYNTYFLRCNVVSTLVEREHPVDDTIGVNTIDEGIDFGEMKDEKLSVPTGLDTTGFIVGLKYNMEFNPYSGTTYTGIYTQGRIYSYSSADGVSDVISNLTSEKEDGVIFVSVAPSLAVGGTFGDAVTPSSSAKVELVEVGYTNHLNGYTPRNNKLYCYPYNCLVVDNNHGTVQEYTFEHFGDGIKFTLHCNLGVDTSCRLIPYQYKGSLRNDMYGMSLPPFPHCTYQTESFKAWLNNNALMLGIQGGSALATGNYLGVATTLGNVFQKAQYPNTLHGKGGGSINTAMNTHKYTFYHRCITPQYAKMLDDYFTMYGYKTNRVKTPNLTSRSDFNYVKTYGDCVKGSVPVKALNIFNNMFKNGVTFWKSWDGFLNHGL